jgi:hypothetical protein
MSARFFDALEGRQFLSGNPVVAPDPNGPNPDADAIQQRDRDQLRDGSCQKTADASANSTFATQDRIQKRLRDGSCRA